MNYVLDVDLSLYPKLVSSPELPSINPDPRKDEQLLHGLEMIENLMEENS